MSVRLGQFYALMLLLACLVTNIAFFSEVREPFLGDEDPMPSVKSAFSELDIQAKIAGFYPKVQSEAEQPKVDEVPALPPPAPPEAEKPIPRVEPPTPREPRRQPAPSANNPPAEPRVADPMVDPFLSPVSPPKELEEPKPAVSVVVPERNERNLQTVAVMPAPTPVAAVMQPVIAEQFKPIIVEPKPTAPVKPSSTPVWDTIDTFLDRPIRYD